MKDCGAILESAGYGPDEIKKISDDIQARIDSGEDYQSIIKDINKSSSDVEFEAKMAAVGVAKRGLSVQEIKRRVFDDNKYVSTMTQKYIKVTTATSKLNCYIIILFTSFIII